MEKTIDIINFLKEQKPFLEKNFNCEEIALFGSFAREEQTDKSDIDLLVEFKDNTKDLYDNELKLKEYLKSKFKRNIDICSKKWIKPIFKPLILSEAIYV